ncbi:MAG: hypothetical protein AB9835_03365 [Eubacteriales bacterium]
MRKLLVILSLCVMLSLPVYAAQDTGVYEELYGLSGLGETSQSLPSDAREILGDGASPSYESAGKVISFGFLWNTVMSLIKKALPSALSTFSLLLGVIICCSVLSALKNSFGSGMGGILDFVSILCLAGASFSVVRECFELIRGLISQLHGYMLSMLPVMTTLYAAGGNAATAVASSAGITVMLGAVEGLAESWLIPLLQICFALSLVGGISQSANLNGVSGLVRSVFTWTLSFVMTALVAALSFQTFLTSAADSMGARTVKFAVSSFVPVVGGLVSDASYTVMSSLHTIKNITGIFGIGVVVLTLLPVLVTVFIKKLCLKLASAIGAIMGAQKESDFLKDMDGLLNMSVAAAVVSSTVFIFAFTIFIRTGEALGG